MTNLIARRSRHAQAALVALLAVMVSACDIMDVDNPNNLLEDDIRKPAAAGAVVNGAQALIAGVASDVWQHIGIVADELVWIGSRDAWQQLDFGYISDPNNEFTDATFPFIGRARWMADEAEEILLGHVANTPTTAMRTHLARAHLYAGLMYMIIGEVQQDFVFSYKTEPAPPIGAQNMHVVLDESITKLDKAVALAQALGDADLETRALAVRARAKHSRAIWSKMKPSVQAADPLVSAPGAVADAQAVLARVSGDWKYEFTYSPATQSNVMATWVNSRAENQFDTLSIVNVDQKLVKEIQSVRLRDPIDDIPDPVITARLLAWKSGDLSAVGGIYPELTVTSARLMHLILAEDALQKNDQATFNTHMNHVRAMDALTPYSGQIPAMDMLKHARRVNLFLTGQRLNDMYRFGIQDPHWRAGSDAATSPGTLLPITIIEIRANPHLSGTG
jgi:starch-binding outer membrane protein, SusD/RagB family